jgi:hypothetical protein
MSAIIKDRDVTVTIFDKYPGNLKGKIDVGAGLTRVIVNPGANEQMILDVAPGGNEYVKELGYFIQPNVGGGVTLEASLSDIISPISSFKRAFFHINALIPAIGTGNLYLTINQDTNSAHYYGRNGNTNLLYTAPPASNRFSIFGEIVFSHGITEINRWFIKIFWIRMQSTGNYQSMDNYFQTQHEGFITPHITHIGLLAGVNPFSPDSTIRVIGYMA